jgi:hypothetical protein
MYEICFSLCAQAINYWREDGRFPLYAILRENLQPQFAFPAVKQGFILELEAEKILI